MWQVRRRHQTNHSGVHSGKIVPHACRHRRFLNNASISPWGSKNFLPDRGSERGKNLENPEGGQTLGRYTIRVSIKSIMNSISSRSMAFQPLKPSPLSTPLPFSLVCMLTRTSVKCLLWEDILGPIIKACCTT